MKPKGAWTGGLGKWGGSSGKIGQPTSGGFATPSGGSKAPKAPASETAPKRKGGIPAGGFGGSLSVVEDRTQAYRRRQGTIHDQDRNRRARLAAKTPVAPALPGKPTALPSQAQGRARGILSGGPGGSFAGFKPPKPAKDVGGLFDRAGKKRPVGPVRGRGGFATPR